MTQGQNNIINLGKIGSTKNSAVIGYKWDSSGSNDNLLTFEHWGTGALQTIDGLGNVTFLGNGSDQTTKWHSGSAYVNAKLDVRQLAIAFSGTDKVTSDTSGNFTFAGNTEFNGTVLVSGTSDKSLSLRNTSGGEMFLKFLNTNGTINGAIISNSNSNTMAFRAGGNTFLSIDSSSNSTFSGDVTISSLVQK